MCPQCSFEMDTDVGAPAILDADTAVNVNNDAVKAREIDLKALSPKSRRGYCSVIAEFIRYLAAKKPDLLSQAFLVHIAATVDHPMASEAWKREVVNFLVQAVPPCPIVLTAFDSQIAKVGALPVSSSRHARELEGVHWQSPSPRRQNALSVHGALRCLLRGVLGACFLVRVCSSST